jgi:4-hydroxybenzoate polyprenyltransferase
MITVTTNILRLLRPRQWTKNLLLFAGLIFSNHFAEIDRIILALLGFVVFCLLASIIYIVNDVRDAESDRVHPLKCKRPIAAGQVTKSTALIVAGVIAVVAGILLFAFFGIRFQAICVLYLLMMLAYSVWLKHVVILDLMIVSLGFVIRAIAGIYAIEHPGETIEITPWFITCIMFLALFVVICKRRHEIVLLSDEAIAHRPVLEHYSPIFLDQMINVATTATVISYALYVTLGAHQQPRSQYMVLTLPFVLYGIFRYLYLVYKREKGGSPELLLFQDFSLLAVVVLWLITIVLILYV